MIAVGITNRMNRARHQPRARYYDSRVEIEFNDKNELLPDFARKYKGLKALRRTRYPTKLVWCKGSTWDSKSSSQSSNLCVSLFFLLVHS